MKIIHGLMTGQVLQRDKKGRGSATITGSCRAAGEVELRVTRNGTTLPGHDWKVTGSAGDKRFIAELKGLRAGGPYTVELRIRDGRRNADALTVEEVFVGDVWILAGQSNMEGVGNIEDAPRPHPQVRAFFMRDEWGQAEAKLHLLAEAVDSVHNDYGTGGKRPSPSALEKLRKNALKGVGPGFAFGLEMRRRTRVPQGLIACAHGGTSMAQWSPEKKNEGGASLYGAMIRRYEKLGQPVAGVLWYQGESDAIEGDIAVYTDRMKKLVAATRADMKLPKLAWFVVQIGCHACATGGFEWNAVQEQQRRLPDEIDRLVVVPAIDLDLDDGIHISGRAQTTLGTRLARQADRMVHGNHKEKPSIRLKEIRPADCPKGASPALCPSIEVVYANVAGKLKSEGRPTGFAILDSDGNDACAIYRTEISGNRVLLYATLSEYHLEGCALSYGHGRFPYCNITDADGRSLPVMQALPITTDHPAHLLDWQTAQLPGTKSLTRVGYKAASSARSWRKAPPRGAGGVLPKPADEETTGLFVLRTHINATEPLTAWMDFGANIPFKLWLSGKPVLQDPKAAVPFNPREYRAELKLHKGKNELLALVELARPAAFQGIGARVGTEDGEADPRIHA